LRQGASRPLPRTLGVRRCSRGPSSLIETVQASPTFPRRLLVVPPLAVVAVLGLLFAANALDLTPGGIHGTSGAAFFLLLVLASACALVCEFIAIPRAITCLLAHEELRSASNLATFCVAVLFVLSLAFWFLMPLLF
jgi:hypothetical protein